MKPTFQTSQPARRGASQRPQGYNVSKSPATDWSFQSSTANLRGGTTPSQSEATGSLTPSLFALTKAFSATSERESRVEAAFFGLIVALGAWPIAHAVYIAINTVG